MSITIEDYVRVNERADEVGCRRPQGISILPENFDSATSHQELVVWGESVDVRKVLERHDLPMGDVMPAGERPRSLHYKSANWTALLFVSAALLSENPHAVSVALGVISNYVTDLFRGRPGKTARLSIVAESSDGACKKLTYEGDPAGIPSLEKAIRRIADE